MKFRPVAMVVLSLTSTLPLMFGFMSFLSAGENSIDLDKELSGIKIEARTLLGINA